MQFLIIASEGVQAYVDSFTLNYLFTFKYFRECFDNKTRIIANTFYQFQAKENRNYKEKNEFKILLQLFFLNLQ